MEPEPYVCVACGFAAASVIAEVGSAVLCFPDRPHLTVRDGGHLLVIPRRHVADRRALSPAEAEDVFVASVLAADALRAAFGTDWFNFQENGNWAVGDGQSPHLHLHVYGRSVDSVAQPFGEALLFPSRTERDQWAVERPSPAEVEAVVAAARSAISGRQATPRDNFER